MYICLVGGKEVPSNGIIFVKHSSLETALNEAKRLQEKEGKTVRVFQLITEY